MGFRNLNISGLAATLCVLVTQVMAGDTCDPNAVDIRGDWGQARFTVEIADDAAERGQGLMHRESMPRNAGMLFIYDAPQRATFWMRNTLIPLDMLFVDERGVVQKIHQNAIPLDETTIDGGEGVVAVLEVNGGISELYGISEGSELRHPSFRTANAAWPCAGSE